VARTIGLLIVTSLLVCGCAGQNWRRSVPPADGVRAGDAPSTIQGTEANRDELDEETASLLDELKQTGTHSSEEMAKFRETLVTVPPLHRQMLKHTLRAYLASHKRRKNSVAAPEKEPSTEQARYQQSRSNNPLRVPAHRDGTDRPRGWASCSKGPTPPEPASSDPLNEHRPRNKCRSYARQSVDKQLRPRSGDRSYRNQRDTDSPVDPKHVCHKASYQGDVRESDGERDDAADSREDRQQHQADLGDWQEHLGAAIRALEAETRRPNRGKDGAVSEDAWLRLLYLAADRRSDAVRPIDHLDARHQEFWSHQLHGLAVYLDDEGMPMAHRRSAVALRQLREAVANLAAESTLDVRNLAFCSEVTSYGSYKEFEKNEFKPDQEVLLYVEVDNFTSQPTAGGFETSLQGSYQILDRSGRRVIDHTFSEAREVCRNRRRDLFIRYRIWMPKNIYPGAYTLELTIEDTKARKFGQSRIDFTIAP